MRRWQPDVRLVSVSPLVALCEGFLSEAECDALVSLGQRRCRPLLEQAGEKRLWRGFDSGGERQTGAGEPDGPHR